MAIAEATDQREDVSSARFDGASSMPDQCTTTLRHDDSLSENYEFMERPNTSSEVPVVGFLSKVCSPLHYIYSDLYLFTLQDRLNLPDQNIASSIVTSPVRECLMISNDVLGVSLSLYES